MSTIQYTLREPAKKCCPSHVHCAILAMSTMQYTLRQTTKKCYPSYYKINISLKKCQQNQVTF